MRQWPAGRMLSLTGWMLAGLLVVGGCKSTPAVPKTLAGDTNLNLPPIAAGETQKPASDVAWKKSANTSSTALAQDHWTAAPKPENPVQTTAFQAQPAPKGEWMPPIPEVMIKDKGDPNAAVVVQGPPPAAVKWGSSKHHAPKPLPNAPNEMNPVALPSYVIRPADVLTVELMPQFTRDKKDQLLKTEKIGLNQPIYGPHPVHQDGTISLGIYGLVTVAGRNVTEAREEIARAIFRRLNPEAIEYKDVLYNLKVDIANYNNGFYYLITNMAGQWQMNELVERFPIVGTETVLDAVSKSSTKGLPGSTSPSRIWVARPNPGHDSPDTILPVDWTSITQHGAMATNWQIMPGDRIYLQAYPVRRFDNTLGRVLSPVYKMLSVGQGINSLRSGSSNTNLVAPPAP
jgi:hypothetical protein